MSEKSFILDVLKSGGIIKPMIIPSKTNNQTGLFNPTVIVEDTGEIVVNIRHCQYTIYHSEKKKFEHEYGPLVYLHPENDRTLTTTNYLCNLDDNLDIVNYKVIDTKELDVPPLWGFVGLEDVRLVKWDNKLFASGVRRDTTPNGVGRMELSCIEKDAQNNIKEISRFRIPAPGEDNSYCEKNWMPIVDKPYHYVKWCNPTEIVQVDPDTKTCVTTKTGQSVAYNQDLRGGSQVIPYKDGYLALVHVVNLFKSEAGRKDAIYRHVFVYWDKNFDLIKISKQFNFMGADIEFCAGMAVKDDSMLITLGFQDNAAYIVKSPMSVIEEYLYD